MNAAVSYYLARQFDSADLHVAGRPTRARRSRRRGLATLFLGILGRA